MKILAAVLLLCGLVASQEVKRPGTDSDGGAIIALGCLGTNIPSSAMLLSWDSAGLATSSRSQTAGTSTLTRYQTRIFSNWQTTGNTYTALTLNVNSSSSGSDSFGGNTGQACVAYSIDSGMSWTSIRCADADGWSQATDTVTLSATQSLATLRVGVCTKGDRAVPGVAPGTDDITVWDIWTAGTTPAPPAPVGTSSSVGNAQRGAVIVF